MSKTITTTDRSRLIRMASAMPVGTPERKAILSGLSLSKVARDTVAEEVAAKLSRLLPGSKVFALAGAGKVGVDLPGYAETAWKDIFAHIGVMNDSISVKRRSSTPVPNPFLPGQEDEDRDEIVVYTDRGRKQVFSLDWDGSANKAASEIAKRLLKGNRVAADGHRLLHKANPADFAHLSISASYDTPSGERWHNDLMKMDPKALNNSTQWKDASMERFAEKVQRVKGNYITKVHIYGRTHNRKVIPIIQWTREDGLSINRESKRELTRLEQERAKTDAIAQAQEVARRKVEWAEEDRLRLEKERAKQEYLEKSLDTGVWSVARSGYDMGEEDDGEYQGYVAEVEMFDSKTDAIAHAKDIGGGTVVKGTQMWNEPVGQVEEHNRDAWTRFYQ